jgi:fatty-acyl-CoA synthase
MDDLVFSPLIGDLPAAAARRWGSRIALEFRAQRWTFIAFEQEVARIAAALQALGVRKGDRVATWLVNCAEAEFLFFAAIRVGAICVPLNTRYRTDDVAYALRQSGSSVLVTTARSGPVDFGALLQAGLGPVVLADGGGLRSEAMPALRHVVEMGPTGIPGAQPWADFVAAAAAEPRPVAIATSDPALMVYTSGTTGNPKGVLLDHAGLRLCLDRTRIMRLRSDDVQLTYLPLFHTYAISYNVIMSLMCGARQVLMESFDADAALDLIETHDVTVVHGFDAHFNDFLQAQRRRPRDIGSLRFGTMTVGADSSVALARAVQEEFCPTLSGYGMTEVWGAVAVTPRDATMEQRCEASGLPQAGVEIKIVDPASGRTLPPGELGEILVRSDSRMVGYHDNPEATAAAIDAEGWFHSGDAGVLRADGHVRYMARYKDMLKVGGENVSPAEIESVLATIPGVLAVAVVGERHERLIEVPVAFVVVEPGVRIDAESVRAHCRGRIASFKIPARVLPVGELPLTPTGKVQKQLLRQRLTALAH